MKMTALSVNLDAGTHPMPELGARRVFHPDKTTIAAMPGGMKSGKTSIAFVHEGGGEVCFAETSLALLVTAMVALAAKYPDEFKAVGVTVVVDKPGAGG